MIQKMPEEVAKGIVTASNLSLTDRDMKLSVELCEAIVEAIIAERSQVAGLQAELSKLREENIASKQLVHGLGKENKALWAELNESIKVGYDCGHEKQDIIMGDCVHCNLIVAEGSVYSLQAKLSKLREENVSLKQVVQCPVCLKLNPVDSAHTCRKHDLVKENEELRIVIERLQGEELQNTWIDESEQTRKILYLEKEVEQLQQEVKVLRAKLKRYDATLVQNRRWWEQLLKHRHDLTEYTLHDHINTIDAALDEEGK